MAETKEKKSIVNSLTQFVGGLTQNFLGVQLSQTTTQYLNLRYYLISNDRSLLSWMYNEHGIVQTLVDQPVDDAFRDGFSIKTDLADEDEVREIDSYLEKTRFVETVKDAVKWSRLFGGGAILIMTDQKPDTPLEPSQISENSNLEFRAVDMWELMGAEQGMDAAGYIDPEYYMYYGKRIHKSRVYRICGKTPPSFIRRQARGWGVSVCEKLVRSINQFMKNQNVIFELMDEAKVDVYKIDGFTTALSNPQGTEAITKRVQLANQVKNFQNAIVMDKEDEYDQKQINFAGMSEVLKQIREQLAADLKMPVTKLFGISSSGFNSGEDDIENYNAMIESEIRSQIKYILIDLLGLVFLKHGIAIPEDLSVEFSQLRMMSTEQEEMAKTNEYNRIISAFQSGLISGEEAQQAINKANLMPIIIDEGGDIAAPVTGDDFVVSDSSVE